MTRSGNWNDNAVDESFFQLIIREQVRRRINANREEDHSDAFDHFKSFYNTR